MNRMEKNELLKQAAVLAVKRRPWNGGMRITMNKIIEKIKLTLSALFVSVMVVLYVGLALLAPAALFKLCLVYLLA